MHKGEYRYSSSPLGKRIDIYETSETENDDCISSLQSQIAAAAVDQKLANIDEQSLLVQKQGNLHKQVVADQALN